MICTECNKWFENRRENKNITICNDCEEFTLGERQPEACNIEDCESCQ